MSIGRRTRHGFIEDSFCNDGKDISMSIRLGIDLIDYQHKSLLKLVDNLCELRHQTISTIGAVTIWDELGRELQAHFADEERLIERVSFARYKQYAHAKDHAAILETFAKLNPTLIVDAQLSASECGTTIRSTLLRHYVNFDLDMYRYLEGSVFPAPSPPESTAATGPDDQ